MRLPTCPRSTAAPSCRPALLVRFALGILVGLAAANEAEAQTGGVAGSVVDARTQQPLAAAQVFAPEFNLGVLSNASGEFTLENLPAGTSTINAQRIGYRAGTQQVTITAGQTLQIRFELAEDALALDAVVVTGTPGGTQRRAIGNVVSTVDVGELTERQSFSNMQQLLTGRTPGVDFGRSSGNIGLGSSIRIRGVSTLNLLSQPLIYVDGVRVDNQTTRGPNTRAGPATSALDDFNPADIASIEVIKGPAAATLYGTEASAGVIQIITHRGAAGAPQFNLMVSQGTNFFIDPAGYVGDHAGCRVDVLPCPESEIFFVNIYEHEKAATGNDIFNYGHNQQYNLNVRGGTDAIRYFLSGEYTDQQGIVSYNWSKRFNGRANVGVLLPRDLSLDVSVGYMQGETSYMQQMEEGGILENLLWGNANLCDTPNRCFLRVPPEVIETVSATRDANRITASVTASHTPRPWLTQRLIVGIDRSAEENQQLVPRHPDGAAGPYQQLSLGRVALLRPIINYSSVDYGISANYDVRPSLSMTTSTGLQYYSSNDNMVYADGSVFASPAIRSIEGAANKDVGQLFVPNKSMGVYLQQEVAINDRIYLTAAVRADDNSAFGADFDAAIYPKLSAAWVISEEPFWRWSDQIESLRIRSAWGQAGRQPSTFAAVTLFEPSLGPGGSAAVSPGTMGNPDVGPEVGTEIEVGFEAALLSGRLTADVTYFHQTVKDALAAVPLAPSMAFPGSQSANLAELQNWGWEIGLNARLIERSDWSLELGFSGAHSMNEVTDLGGRPPTGSLQEGHPFPLRMSRVLVSAELDAQGLTTNALCDAGTGKGGIERGGAVVPCNTPEGNRSLILGTQFSPYSWSFTPALTFRSNLSVFAMVHGEYGQWRDSGTVRNRLQSYPSDAYNLRRNDPLYVTATLQRNPNDCRFHQCFDASFWKLREVGARYNLPSSLAGRMGAQSAAVTLSARDLWTIWQATEDFWDVPLGDPEVGPPEVGLQAATGQMPGIASFTASVRVAF